MKLTKSRLRKIIKEEIIKEGMQDDYKAFQKEVSTTEAGWKKRMSELDAKSANINSVKQAQTAIHELLEYFKKTPVSEALGTVRKANVKKFERALGVMENILEDTNGWLEENN
jgi:uncharacterized membrane protein YgaE (UPF0421/DUF939 family)